MEKIILTKDGVTKEIEVKKHNLAYFFPTWMLAKRKLWRLFTSSIITTLLFFPLFTFRIWLARELWKEEVRSLLLKGWEYKEENKELLEKELIIPSLKYLDLENNIYFTNDILLKKIQITTPRKFKEWNEFYNLSWESGMYWIGILSAFFLITGIGDLVFNFVMLSKAGNWTHSNLKKKGYRPYTNVDELRLKDKDALKRKYN